MQSEPRHVQQELKMDPSDHAVDEHAVPVLLLKTRSTPGDSYEDTLSAAALHDGRSLSPRFIPVLRHRFHEDGLDTVKKLLRNRQISRDADASYGGIIFTSQRAVEAFAHVCGGEGKGTKAIPRAYTFYIIPCFTNNGSANKKRHRRRQLAAPPRRTNLQRRPSHEQGPQRRIADPSTANIRRAHGQRRGPRQLYARALRRLVSRPRHQAAAAVPRRRAATRRHPADANGPHAAQPRADTSHRGSSVWDGGDGVLPDLVCRRAAGQRSAADAMGRGVLADGLRLHAALLGHARRRNRQSGAPEAGCQDVHSYDWADDKRLSDKHVWLRAGRLR